MSGKVALLDVNVLVALFDPDHVHHDVAHGWFAGQRTSGWATCPLTEVGFVRTTVALSKGRELITAPRMLEGLQAFIASGHHHFWTDELSLGDAGTFDSDAVIGPQQLTDVYLLGLAVKHDGVLATFDRRLPVWAVKGATTAHLAVLSPVV